MTSHDHATPRSAAQTVHDLRAHLIASEDRRQRLEEFINLLVDALEADQYVALIQALETLSQARRNGGSTH